MFIIIFLLGLSLALLISSQFKQMERLAMAFPLGFGTASFVMFTFTLVGIKLTASTVEFSLAVLTLLCSALAFFNMYRQQQLPWQQPRPVIDLSFVNAAWVVLAGMIVYLVWGITRKCLYWPPAEFDTILGYDLLSKAIAREGVLANSILTNKTIVEQCGPRLLYPPLLAFSNSLCYLTGMETPKLVNSLFYLSWVPLFYLLLRRLVNATNAIFFTLWVVVVPEMYAHASFSLTNLPCAIYSTIAVMSFVIWFEKKLEGFFTLSVVAMCFSIWTRSDVVVFIGAILLVLAWYSYRTKTFRHLLLYLIPLVPFLVWNAYTKAHIPRAQTGFFIQHLFFDAGKLGKVCSAAWEIMSSSNIYGITFYLFILALVINILAIVKQRDKWEVLAIIAVALGGYTLLFYQMTDADGSLFAPGGWMQSGYKRGLFCYAPLVLFYVAISKYVSMAFDLIHERLTLFNSKA
ncbi:MAG: hypothetical protein U0T84_01575 [Chitinophagales bacterium]